MRASIIFYFWPVILLITFKFSRYSSWKTRYYKWLRLNESLFWTWCMLLTKMLSQRIKNLYPINNLFTTHYLCWLFIKHASSTPLNVRVKKLNGLHYMIFALVSTISTIRLKYAGFKWWKKSSFIKYGTWHPVVRCCGCFALYMSSKISALACALMESNLDYSWWLKRYEISIVQYGMTMLMLE